MPTIDRAFRDKRLFAAALGDLSSWQVWLTVLCAAFALPLDAQQMQSFAAISGGRLPPSKAVRELWIIAGRRSGKSRTAALIACFIALFIKHKAAPGERPMVLVIAGSVEQAATVFSYVKGFLEAAPVLAKEVAGIKRHEITLRNGVVIAVHSNSFRTVRGRTLAAVVFDEVSFWRDEATSAPDVEMYTAVLPALATTNGMLIGISTPYRKIGLLHQKWRDHYGQGGDDVLIVQGRSQLFNPSLSDAMIATQRAADPTGARAEWDAEFRTDVSAFLDDELIAAAVDHGRPLELPPRPNVQHMARADAAGGAGGGESYTLAIAHKESDGRLVVDVVRGVSGMFDPHAVTAQYAALCRQYHVAEVVTDNYAKEWVAAAWHGCGISCRKGELRQSDVYLECVPLFTRGLVRLPDHARVLRELRQLERVTRKFGKDAVDHPKNGTDDYAAVVCGVLLDASTATSALWRAESFATTLAAMPAALGLVFAAIVVGDAGQAGIGYFAKSIVPGSVLVVLDVELAPLSPALLQGMMKRLDDFSRGRVRWIILAQSPLKNELERLGVRNTIEPLDFTLSDPLLAVAASVHVANGRVQLCAEVLSKEYPLGFLRGTAAADTDDPLTLAVLSAIVLSFDERRTTTRPRKKVA
jgi:hypothetical protein